MWRNFFVLLTLIVLSTTCNNLFGTLDPENLKFNSQFVSSARVVNGNVARRGQFPWQALIYIRTTNNQRIFCSGALISDAAVLTEADYLLDSLERRVFVGSNIFGQGIQVLGKQFRTHPRYNPNSAENNGYNIAVLRLAERVPLSRLVQPLRLTPDRYEYYDFPNQSVQFAGFGSSCK